MINMTRKSTQILNYLKERPQQMVEYGELIRELWGPKYPVDQYSINCLRVHVSHARKELTEGKIYTFKKFGLYYKTEENE